MAQVHDALARMNADDESQGSVWECFHRKNIKRTFVSAFIFFIQNSTGSVWVIGYMSYFMQLGGMSPARSFDATVGISGLMTVGNMCGWFFIEKFGRRGTALWGTAFLALALLLIGILAIVQEKGSQGALWGQGEFFGRVAQYLNTANSKTSCFHGHLGFHVPRHNWFSFMGHQLRERHQ